MKFFNNAKFGFKVYFPIVKNATKKALKNACLSALITFISTLLAQLQNTQQITNITFITALLAGTLTFLVETKRNIQFLRLIKKI
jgi:uncharacterized membrane protein YjjP (DUF1212 family)